MIERRVDFHRLPVSVLTNTVRPEAPLTQGVYLSCFQFCPSISSLVNTPKLQDLLFWVEEVIDPSAGDFQPVEKRANAIIIAIAIAIAFANSIAIPFAFIFAFTNSIAHVITNANFIANANTNAITNAIAITFTHANGNANSNALKEFINYIRWSSKFQIYRNVNSFQLINKLEILQRQILDNKKSKIFNHKLGKKIMQTWLKAFHLTPEMLNLSKSEREALDNYLYANRLIIECKKAAVWVSPEIWEGIESRMLLPVKN